MNDINNKLAKIKLVIFDVDGVLTDAKLYFDDKGTEHKAFDARDGLGIKLLMEYGIEVAVITGRRSGATKARLYDNLGIRHYYEGVLEKRSKMQDLASKLQFSMEQILYVGDDLIDLGVMCEVGLAVAVADAEKEVKEVAHWVLKRSGGAGAAREVCDQILAVQGKWDDIIDHFKHGKKYSN